MLTRQMASVTCPECGREFVVDRDEDSTAWVPKHKCIEEEE